MRSLNIILIALTTFTGCNKKSETVTTNATDTTKTKAMTNDSLTYLALGDSYTVGEAEPQAQSYPYQLIDSLNNSGYKVLPPNVIATTGWTTQDLINAIASSGISGKKFDFVTLLIGVNDQYQHLSIDVYKQNFTQVLHEAIQFAGGDTSKVFVISIPDWGVTPFANGQDSVIYPQIMAFNAVNLGISKAAGVNYIDVTPVSRTAADDPSMIAPDGLHFSGKMYAEWVKLLEPVAASRLKK
jgi:lysophospholipase L1-like esterase